MSIPMFSPMFAFKFSPEIIQKLFTHGMTHTLILQDFENNNQDLVINVDFTEENEIYPEDPHYLGMDNYECIDSVSGDRYILQVTDQHLECLIMKDENGKEKEYIIKEVLIKETI